MQSFIDTASITIKAGSGGDGAVSLRHEKYVPKGGPDGGDGGDGGSVIIKADSSLNTLYPFRHKKHFKASHGERGGKSNKHGKSAEDLIISVPVGTQVKIKNVQTGDINVVDMVKDQQSMVAAKGGKGGKGNARFKSSRQQTPRFATEGTRGDEVEVGMELKLLADVGLVGQPNAGKSTMLSRLTKARPEIASYPFTTLEPNLGIAEYGGESYVIADIPGLIEGASLGRGLGDQFLRHVERTKVLLHLVSLDPQEAESPMARFQEVLAEMRHFNSDLLTKKTLVILTKADLCSEQEVQEVTAEFKDIGIDAIISNPEDEGNYAQISAAGLQLLNEAKAADEVQKRAKADDDKDSVVVYDIDSLSRVYRR